MEKGALEDANLVSSLMGYPTELINQLNEELSSLNFNKALKILNNEENRKIILQNYQHVLRDVVWIHLINENYEKNPKLYEANECILMALAEHCYQDKAFVFELLEHIDAQSKFAKDEHDNVFTSILRSLQVLLLKQTDNKHNTLNTALMGIEEYLHDLKPPALLEKKCLEEEDEMLLENDDEIKRILMVYITLDLFYAPLVKKLAPSLEDEDLSLKLNRRNVLFCFILRLLGKPLGYLDLTIKEEKTKTYSREVAENMVASLFGLKPNFFGLLEIVEERVRWPTKTKASGNINAIFLHPEKTPLVQLGILFYLVIAEEVCIEKVPKVYSPMYVLKMGLYLVYAMLQDENESIRRKGLKLCSKLIENAHDQLERYN